MKIKDLMALLISEAPDPIPNSETGDVLKAGDGDAEIVKIAVTMFPTVEVIEKAAEYGANFLLVHEPLFYNNSDKKMPYESCYAKKALLEKHGITVWRFHDYAHSSVPDLIFDGQLHYSGLKGHFEKGKYWAVNRFILDTPMTTLELVKTLEKNLELKHLRIAGARDNLVKTVSCCFGTPGHVAEEFAECDTVLTGEVCEWDIAEYARDYHQLGGQKSLVVMGHCNSEKFGMKLLAERLAERYPDIPVKYFDCGDVYSYTDD